MIIALATSYVLMINYELGGTTAMTLARHIYYGGYIMDKNYYYCLLPRTHAAQLFFIANSSSR
jgi:hypothetical protein